MLSAAERAATALSSAVFGASDVHATGTTVNAISERFMKLLVDGVESCDVDIDYAVQRGKMLVELG